MFFKRQENKARESSSIQKSILYYLKLFFSLFQLSRVENKDIILYCYEKWQSRSQ